MSEEKQDGFMKRRAKGIGRYVKRRFGTQYNNKLGMDTLKTTLSDAKKSITPYRFDAEELITGYRGRYSDGGREEFARMMKTSGTSESDLDALAKHRRKLALMSLIFALLCLGVGSWMMINAESLWEIFFGFFTGVWVFVFIIMALRYDFRRWQVENRRVGGFQEYFTDRKSGISPEKNTGTSVTIKAGTNVK